MFRRCQVIPVVRSGTFFRCRTARVDLRSIVRYEKVCQMLACSDIPSTFDTTGVDPRLVRTHSVAPVV